MGQHQAGSTEGEYAVGDRVRVVEGYPGKVTEVLDSPFDAIYSVLLDAGMGGGQWSANELTPIGRAAASAEATGVHTAADDYPELGTILLDRPNHAHSIPAADYFGGRVASVQGAARVHCAECDVDYFADSSEEMHHHASGDLYLPVVDPPAISDATAEGAPETDLNRTGFAHGRADAIERGYKNPQDDDPQYRAGYNLGWAVGVEAHAPAPHPMASGDGINAQAGVLDFLRGDGEPTKNWGGAGHNWSYDWCRFRKNSRCFYPKTLNETATQAAGYAVWNPEDRGYCPRIDWGAQEACPVGEPGPHVPGGFTDATVPWDAGGQRGGVPDQAYVRAAALRADREFGLHFTATFADVRTKAKRIRTSGGVRILSSHTEHGVVAAHVQGDAHVYETRITKVPGRSAVAHWECGCAWGAYSWGRTGRWRRFEGRMCSHALATQYEAQSRGMFGRTVHEDPQPKSWSDPIGLVKRPGDWDRDKGRFSSLRAVEAAFEDEATDISPAQMLAVDLLSEGAEQTEVAATLSALGVADPDGLLKVAREGSFMARVRGLVKRLFVADGDITDERGEPVLGEQVLYPTYDPHLGLDPRDSGHRRFTSLSRVALLGQVLAAGTDLEAAAKAMLTLARRNEPATTSMLNSLARKNSGHLEGLDHRFKTLPSLLRKMKAETEEFDGDAGRTAINMSDTLRYTMVANPKNYVRTTKTTLDALHKAGYRTRIKNYWPRGDSYQGINVAALTPSGHPFELQFHTPESSRVKEKDIHPLYERFRTSTSERERKSLHERMTEKVNRIEVPGGVLDIGVHKRQDYRPLPGNEHPAPHRKQKAASASTYRYLRLHTVTSHTPTTVLREYHGDDDHRVEIWRGGKWQMDNNYARHTMLGSDARTEEITEDEANAHIASGRGKKASAQDESWVFEALLEMAAAADDAEPEPPVRHEGSTPMSADEWGLALPEQVAKTAEFYTVDEARAAGRAAAVDDEFGLSFDDGLDEAPEQALPVTYGEDEAEQARTAILAALGSQQPAQQVPGPDLLAAHTARLAGGQSGPDPFAHLLAGQRSEDVAAKAREFLSKSALKDFTPAEREQIIGEGVGTRAGNFDDLDITGTHYAALPEDPDPNDTTLWM